MPFTSEQMEDAWTALMNSIGDTEWIDIVSTTTGQYFRLPVSVGGLRQWNRATGTWDSVSPPASLVAVTVRIL